MTDSSPGPNRGRRRYLATLVSGALAGIAGCDGSSDDTETQTTTVRTEPDPTETATESATDSATDPPPTETEEPAGDWSEGGPPTRDGWSVTFADRFEGGELDESKWSHGSGMGVDCAGGSLECWEPEQTWVDGETDRFVIETTDEPSGGREYTSGGINTREAFTQEFGYFEAKSRPAAVPGALPAFWMWWNPDDWGHRREIDFYEIYGTEAQQPVHSVHVDCEPRTPGEGSPEWRGGRSELDAPADEQFHVWGCEWTPDSVTFYIDGEERVRVEDDILAECLAGEELWVVLSAHVNEDMGDPTEADYPYTHEFEWVRVWQRDEWVSE